MKVPLADLRAQYFELKDEIDAAIVGVIESTMFSGGPVVAKLEAEVAAFCGAQYGIGVASGTDALVLSLRACGVGAGDEVITTPFSFAATTEALALVGAKPVYVDIDACTFNLDTAQIENALTERTKALLPVDLYGQMTDRVVLNQVAQRHGLKMIVDAAQAIGAKQNGRLIGADGDATTLSFYPTKNLGAYGDGGMILTNNAEIADLARSLRGHGTVKHKYLHEHIGYCSRLDAIQAAVLAAKLPRLEEWNRRRRRNAERYQTLLADVASDSVSGLTLPRAEAGNYHIYHQYTICHPRRDELQAFLAAHEVASGVYYPMALHLQPAYAYLGYREGDFPIAERAAREVLSLPIYEELTEEQIQYVAGLVRQFCTP